MVSCRLFRFTISYVMHYNLYGSKTNYNSIIVFICTDARPPICIFLHVSGQNESVHIKTTDTLVFENQSVI